MDDPDLGLLTRWRAGDRAAGQALFGRYFDSLYRFFRNKCEADADELVQATLLACLDAKRPFRGDSRFRTYLFGIARNKLYHHFAARKRGGALDFSVTSIADLVTTPGTALARDQAHRALLTALRQLPLEQQTLLELHYWEDMGIAELAQIFDSPAATIRTRLHRARKALREQVEAAAPREALETLETMDAWARGLGPVGEPKAR